MVLSMASGKPVRPSMEAIRMSWTSSLEDACPYDAYPSTHRQLAGGL
jgi:hypothetical protein